MSNAAPYRQLGEEPFGARLRRARQLSGFELREVADLVSGYMITSHARISRLEKLNDPPPDQQRRALAYLAMLVYGFDPGEMGLTDVDLPSQIRGRIDVSNLRKTSSGWKSILAHSAA